jgi:hypothetical protein
MQAFDIDNLKKYTKDELVQIAICNKLFDNNYYMTKNELQMAIYTCHLCGIVID